MIVAGACGIAAGEKTADRLAGYLVYFALGAAVLTFIITRYITLTPLPGVYENSSGSAKEMGSSHAGAQCLLEF
jgi:hypothetical protein